eukprot:TRINITY_DN2216_c0_g1_i2.p1 TRINITY_DN2216_c0_g1~~TRINITY_DN2216_c0_g1_i2.p1  ORF type:complete len:148 (+),score=19.62 TRINITY_DN2216_c0_g1_i2:130-573(+)
MPRIEVQQCEFRLEYDHQNDPVLVLASIQQNLRQTSPFWNEFSHYRNRFSLRSLHHLYWDEIMQNEVEETINEYMVSAAGSEESSSRSLLAPDVEYQTENSAEEVSIDSESDDIKKDKVDCKWDKYKTNQEVYNENGDKEKVKLNPG